jgi:hypothetical protein
MSERGEHYFINNYMANITYVWGSPLSDIGDRSHVIINKTKVLLSDIADLSHVIINKPKVLLSQT